MAGVIVLLDGEHHPSVVRDAIAGLDPVGAVWCGGEEKVPREVLDDPLTHFGIEFDPDEPREDALRRLAPDATTVVDLADEPVLAGGAKLRLASSSTSTQSSNSPGLGGLNRRSPLVSNSPIDSALPVRGSNHQAFTFSPLIASIRTANRRPTGA